MSQLELNLIFASALLLQNIFVFVQCKRQKQINESLFRLLGVVANTLDRVVDNMEGK